MDWDQAIAALAERGLGAVGVADGAPWQQVLPGCRSVVVIGSGGPALWDGFVAELRRDPAALTAELHPLDAYVRRALARIDPDGLAGQAPGRRWVRCAADDPANFDVDFRTLALGAGLGWPSPLGLLLHPAYGPWLGLRAACFTAEALGPTGPRPEPAPCVGCPAPCRGACPAGAVRPAGEPFDIAACARQHVGASTCAAACHSRCACPVGRAHRYSEIELHYHSDRATGRVRLARELGIRGDLHQGQGPAWE